MIEHLCLYVDSARQLNFADAGKAWAGVGEIFKFVGPLAVGMGETKVVTN